VSQTSAPIQTTPPNAADSLGHSPSSRPRSLAIIDEQKTLRTKASPFRKPLALSDSAEAALQPRALRALAQIVDGGLCHRCGSCVGICPTDALGLDEQAFPTVKNLSACTDCDLCVRVCPGDEFAYQELHQEKYGTEPDFSFTHGKFDRALLAYASQDEELRAKSTSGGLVTALLLHLLDSKQIDGAIVIAPDEDVLWKGKPIVARTREEIISAAKSKYSIAPTNSVFSEIREIPGTYALVGLPCQIHGYVKAAQLDPRIAERVVLTIGLFCHAAIEHEGFEVIWETLGEKVNGAKRFVSRLGKHPGAPHIELADGTMYPVYFGNKQGWRPSSMEVINVLYRLYTPPRCLTCFDALAEFADISIGDPWLAPPEDHVDFHQGWSFGLVRTQRGADVLASAEQESKVATLDLTEAEALKCNRHMATEKRWRAYRMIETHKRQGRPIPQYGDFELEFPKHSGKQFVLTEGNLFTHICCFIPRLRAPLLRLFLGPAGYWLLWLNNKRRRVKLWWRDSKNTVLRKLRGRR
jgi:coenzyme F420 hydrogenase subunit beta